MSELSAESEIAEALANPQTSVQQLQKIYVAYPDLRERVVQHPGASPELLRWIASIDDTEVSRLAIARLSTFAHLPATSLAPSALGNSARKKGTSKRWVLLGVAAMAILLIAALIVFLPGVLSPGNISYAKDYKELPPVTIVDVKQGIWGVEGQEEGDADFVPLSNINAVAAISEVGLSSYYAAQIDYKASVEAVAAFDKDYKIGFDDAVKCLKDDTPLGYYYTSRKSYCEDRYYKYRRNDGLISGFRDGLAGAKKDPVSSSLRPKLLEEPTLPKKITSVMAVDLKSAQTKWTLDLSTIVQKPMRVTSSVSNDNNLVLALSDVLQSDGSGNALLVLLDGENGSVLSKVEVSSKDFNNFKYFGKDRLIYWGPAGITAVSSSDLSQVLWHYGLEVDLDAEYYYVDGVLGDRYVYSTDGYLNFSDGKNAGLPLSEDEFLSVVSRDGSTWVKIAVPKADSKSKKYRVSGFDVENNSATWTLDSEGYPSLGYFDGKLVLSDEREVAVYSIDGGSAKKLWSDQSKERYAVVSFVDQERVILRSPKNVSIYNFNDGKRLGSVPVLEYVGDAVPEDLVVGRSTFSVISGRGEVVSYGIENGGIKQLWRTPEVHASVEQVNGTMILKSTGKGILGIVGIGDKNWSSSDWATEE